MTPQERGMLRFAMVCYAKCTFMHLADAFVQSDLQYIQAINVLSVCSLGIEPTTFCAANTMLYH